MKRSVKQELALTPLVADAISISCSIINITTSELWALMFAHIFLNSFNNHVNCVSLIYP